MKKKHVPFFLCLRLCLFRLCYAYLTSVNQALRLSARQSALYAYVNDVLTEHKHKRKKKAYAYAYVAALLTSA